MMECECSDLCLVDPREHPNWNALVLRHEAATVFHSREWAEVLCQSYGYTPLFLARAKGGRLSALLPLIEVDSWLTGRRGISLPFSDECEPLGVDADEDLRVFFDAAAQVGRDRGWRYIELRGGFSGIKTVPVASSYYTHSLPLISSNEEIFGHFDGSVRRAIRKAERSSLNVTVGTDLRAVESFFLLHCQTRKRHGAPPQPWKFFQKIQERILTTGKGFVVLAAEGTRIVAAAVFFMFGRKGIYKFGASDERFQESRGNNAVMWTGIRELRKSGCAEMSFGRTSLGQEGLRRFKLGWGSFEERVNYIRFDISKNCGLVTSDRSEGSFSRVFKLLPVTVNRAIGAVLYSHVA